MSKASYHAHHNEYSSDNAFDAAAAYHVHTKNTKAEFNVDCPLGNVLMENPQLKIGIDIGSGTGWATRVMSEKLSHVYGIEPSDKAQEIAKRILHDKSNISWINNFAYEGLKQITLNEPCLFNSLVVLSHIENDDVIKILDSINEKAPIGSALSFAECYGLNWNDGNLWHIRSKEWWEENLPGWKFKFYEVDINHPAGAKKAFSAVKTINLQKTIPEQEPWIVDWLDSE